MKVFRLSRSEGFFVAWVASLIAFLALKFFMSLPVMLLAGAVVLLLGVGALVGVLWAAIRQKSLRSQLVALSAASVVAIWFFLPTHLLGVYVRAAIDIPQYTEAVSQLKKGVAPRCVTNHECIPEQSPLFRVAFVWDGILDNWVGIIYDPTGAVLRVDENRKLFGGDLISAQHLWGPWYFCGFT